MRLATRVQGAGPDLVLVHGWGLNAAVWEPLTERLAGRHRLTSIELPGHGASPPPGEGTTTADLVEALLAAAPARAAWLGWSLGGLLALAVAQAAPDRITRLGLLATNPCFTRRADWPCAMAPEVLAGFARDLETQPQRTLQRFLGLVARGAPSADTLRDLRRRVLDAPAPHPRGLALGLELLRDRDLRPALAAVSQPLWLGFGARDTLVPLAAADAVAALCPTARITRFEGAGHAPLLSHPDALVTALGPLLA